MTQYKKTIPYRNACNVVHDLSEAMQSALETRKRPLRKRLQKAEIAQLDWCIELVASEVFAALKQLKTETEVTK